MQINSKTIFASVTLALVALQSISAQDNSIKMTNPLLQRSTLQYQAPPFNLIKDEHFKPAFEYGLKVHDAEIDKIANNTAILMLMSSMPPNSFGTMPTEREARLEAEVLEAS